MASKGGKEASERHDPITNCTRHLNLDLSTRLEGPTLPFTDSFTHVFYSLVVAFFMCATGSTPQDEHQGSGRGRGRYQRCIAGIRLHLVHPGPFRGTMHCP